MPAAPALRSPKKQKTVTFVDILMEDHRLVKAMFKRFEDTDVKKQKQKIAHEILRALKIHTQVEEEIVYPAVRTLGGEPVKHMMDEADEEHHVAKGLMEEIKNYGSEDGHYDAKVTVLGEIIEHHAGEEEEPGGMFSRAKKLSGIDGITRHLISRKKELSHQYGA